MVMVFEPLDVPDAMESIAVEYRGRCPARTVRLCALALHPSGPANGSP
jgi:hypothetical protein